MKRFQIPLVGRLIMNASYHQSFPRCAMAVVHCYNGQTGLDIHSLIYHHFLSCTDCTSVTLPSLLDPISCVIEDKCLGFQCCVNIDLIITTISQSVYINIDPCNFTIYLGFGAWYVNDSLLTYQLNSERKYNLGNAVEVRYVKRVYPMRTEGYFKVDD